MKFTLLIPYQSFSETVSYDDYYKGENDYINALKEEEANYRSLIFNAVATRTFDDSTFYAGFGQHPEMLKLPTNHYEYAKCDCVLYSPNGFQPETVDSMIDKFVRKEEFIVTVNFNSSSMDSEFEEEMKQWNSETRSILKYRSKMGEDWVNENIPKRDLRLSFYNKSNKLVNFELKNCEIEEKLSENRYLLYINAMSLLK